MLTSGLSPIARNRLPSETVALSQFLLGKLLVRRIDSAIMVLRITETEAYPPGDEAAHHYRRITPRNRSLFGPLGTAYVYCAYGISWMLNMASESDGVGAGILFRAGEPLLGVADMQARRPGAALRDLARGPGRLAQALGIDRSLDGLDLCSDAADAPIGLADDGAPPPAIGISVRIGITRAVERPWRFFIPGSPCVSGPAKLNRAAD